MQRRNTSTKHTKFLNVYFKYNESSTHPIINSTTNKVKTPRQETTLERTAKSTADKTSGKTRAHTHQIPYNKSSTVIDIRIRRSIIHSPTPQTNTLSNGSVRTADKSKQVVRKNSTHTHQVPKSN